MKALILTIFTFSGVAQASSISKAYIDESFEKAANKVGVPVILLRAICAAESRHDPKAYAYNDGKSNNHAFGLCQILYTTALDMGMKANEACKRDFRKDIPRIYKECPLFGPYTSAYYAARYLKLKLDQYNDSWISAIAAYNTGSLKMCTTGKVRRARDGKVIYKCEIGGLLNQKYVDRVLNFLAKEGGLE